MIRVAAAAMFAAVALCAASKKSHAGSELFAGPATCTKINCGSIYLNSTVELDTYGNTHPVVFELKGTTYKCIRIDVITQRSNGSPPADTQATLVSPAGKVWRNDDRSGGDLRPLIVAEGDSVGFYTLSVGRYGGSGSRVDITIAYGQYEMYPYGVLNPNCYGLMQPVSGAASTAAKK